MKFKSLVLLALCPALGACHGAQSVLATAGPQARDIAMLAWWMFLGATLVLVAVVVLTAWAVWGPPERRKWLADTRIVFVGGVALPVVVLSVLLVYGLLIGARLGDGGPASLRLEVVGEQWWWRVRYLDETGTTIAETANEIHVPVGETVELALTTADVLHSFWVPALAGKLDMIPGQTNVLRIRADAPGIYRGQCAEFCGGPHALMAFYVVAEEAETFARWLARQRQPLQPAAGLELQEGRDLFLAAGCGACHTVRGTDAAGLIAPDLTHVGGRSFIAGGTLPMNRTALSWWIRDNQSIKPHNRMPPFGIFSDREVDAISAWLESLK